MYFGAGKQTPLIQIQEFNGEIGEDPTDYLDSLNDVFGLYPMTEKEKIIIASSHLRKDAQVWWKLVAKSHVSFREYEQMVVKKFWCEEYQHIVMQRAIQEEHRVGNESGYANFFIRQVCTLRNLTCCQLTDDFIITLVRQKLPKWVQQIIMENGRPNIEQVIDLLTIIDDTHQELWEKDCEYRGTIANVLCNEESGKEIVSLNMGPIIDVTSLGEVVLALIDTGSQVSLLAVEWINKFHHKKGYLRLPIKPIKLTLANGKGVISENYQIWLEMMIGKQGFGQTFLVVKGLAYQMVLGSDFLAQHEGVINYATKKCQIGKEQVTFKEDLATWEGCETCMMQQLHEVEIAKKVEMSGLVGEVDRRHLERILKEYVII